MTGDGLDLLKPFLPGLEAAAARARLSASVECVQW